MKVIRSGASIAAAVVVTLLATLIPVSAATGWSIVPSPTKIVRHGAITAISCVSAANCEAVGRATNAAGAPVAAVWEWNGFSWVLQKLPSGGASVGLGGISCVSTTRCSAVGQTSTGAAAAEAWNGRSWRVKTVPLPAGATFSTLYAVSCASATRCIAVGSYFDGTNTLTLAELWNGSAWSVQPTPNPSGGIDNALNAVSCSSTSSCDAIGGSNNGNPVSLAESWDGTAWTIQPTPSSPSSPNLTGISCSASTQCMAVGSYFSGSANLTLAEQWDGTSWTVVPTPNPSSNAFLSSVSCTSANMCAAAGDSFSSMAGNSLVEAWTGSAWTVQSTPNPPGATSSFLSGISCVSASRCVAGGRIFRTTVDLSLVETWNGTSWSAQLPPNPLGAVTTFLPSVACTAAAACAAVGSYGNPNLGGTTTLAALWNGSSWAFQTTPAPSGSTLSGFSGVACTAASACTAVGGYRKGSVSRVLAERWNGTSWTIQPTPDPLTATQADLASVACASATMCTAVGQFFNSTTSKALVESWNGTKWSIQPIPSPPGSTFTSLNAVSCPATNQCTAVGSYNTASATFGLAEEWNGTKWTIQATPTPTGASFVSVTGVACPSTTQCTAVGSYQNGGNTASLAMEWNGSTWSIQTTPDPAGASQSSLSGISCASTTLCTAVGYYQSGFSSLTLAEQWNGTAWSVQTTPNPTGANGSNLLGVSCPTTVACMAVGESSNNGINAATVAEAWSA